MQAVYGNEIESDPEHQALASSARRCRGRLTRQECVPHSTHEAALSTVPAHLRCSGNALSFHMVRSNEVTRLRSNLENYPGLSVGGMTLAA